VTLNLAETSVVKSQPSVPYGANLHYMWSFMQLPVPYRIQVTA